MAAETDPTLPEAPPRPVEQLLRPGTRVAQYELIRELGRGGMGRVYLARDTRLGRRVAIKFLVGRDARFTGRFLAEARATAGCNHENIVIIHEVGEHEQLPFMVLEYLEGDPLRDLMGRRLSPSRAVEIAVPLVRALVRAHELGIVHRDLKPENVFVTTAGVVKVLDFGIATAMQSRDEALIGTLPYMAPEQLSAGAIDHRTDLWAVGVVLWEMLAARHPLAPASPTDMAQRVLDLDRPMPALVREVPDLPAPLERAIDRCLAKRPEQRWASAAELLAELERLLPGRSGRQLAEGESPYPGLVAFQEADADRFFGRARDVVRAVHRIRERPLLAVVGPSGVGKSSFVRAGVVPALKGSGETWEAHILRPGRDPLASLASVLQPLTASSATDLAARMAEHRALVDRLRAEPGHLGSLLRSRARQQNAHILLFVDQFEEIYTLAEPGDRAAFTACLAGVADDAAAPLRVVMAMRSDFLDRAADDPRFGEELTRGLVFLSPPDRPGLREALVAPIDLVGYRFEHDDIVERMLDELASTAGALPLLQFAAAKLWDSRDRARKLLTRRGYDEIGGIGGAPSAHADQVLAGLAAPAQKLARALFQRLVTPERTRAVVDLTELRSMGGADAGEVDRLVDHLTAARLLVGQQRGDEGAAVEIVHESLITTWPTLRRWLDEDQEDAAFVEQLRTAARQWDQRDRPQGLLWSGEAVDEARRFRQRYRGRLAARETEFLDAAFALATRAARRRRNLVVGALVGLSLVLAAAAVALVMIRSAQQDTRREAERARGEAERARAAEQRVTDQLAVVKAKEEARARAEERATAASAAEAMSRGELEQAYAKLRDALARAQAEQQRAEGESARARAAATEARDAADKVARLAEEARKARADTERLLERERARVKQLEEERKKIANDLK